MLKNKLTKFFKIMAVFTILLNTVVPNTQVKALTTAVSGDDILAKVRSNSNWGYCIGLVTRTVVYKKLCKPSKIA